MFGQTLFDRFFDQLDVILLMLERPAVQRQLLILALLALAAELVAWQLTDLRLRFFTRYEHEAKTTGVRSRLGRNRGLRRWLRALEHTYSPIIAIVLGHLAVLAFRNSGWQAGLLQQGLLFFWLLLVYRLVVTILYAWQNEKRALFYHQRLLLPLFMLLLIFAIQRVLSGIVDLAGIRLFALSENEITLGAFFIAIIIFYSFLAISWIVQGLLSQFILPRFGGDPGIDHTVQTISRYIVIGAGILVALGSLGLDLSTLAIIGAGLSIGIGFGLQDLIANFVSGILLLFEQSIRPGDIVEVEGKMGIVEKLRIRSTTVRTFDNIEVIIPNQSLLTSSVTTYTHTDRRLRLRIVVGASYNADPQEVREALLAAANRHGLVLDEPAPLAIFTGYGASSIDFELIVWIEDVATRLQTGSDLHFMVWREFEKRKIEIPFPQRDLHVRSGVPWDDLLARRSQTENADASESDGAGPKEGAAEKRGKEQRDEAAEENPFKRLGKLPG